MLQLAAAQNTQLPSVAGADYRCYKFNVLNNYFYIARVSGAKALAFQ